MFYFILLGACPGLRVVVLGVYWTHLAPKAQVLNTSICAQNYITFSVLLFCAVLHPWKRYKLLLHCY